MFKVGGLLSGAGLPQVNTGETMTSSACTVTLVLLLTVFSIVHSSHKKTASGIKENPTNERDDVLSHKKVKQYHQLSQYRDDPQKLGGYDDEDSVPDTAEDMFGKAIAFSSSKENDYVSLLSNSKTYTKHKFDNDENHQTKSFKPRKDNSANVNIHNRPKSFDSDNADPADLESMDESLHHVKQDAYNDWSSSSSLDDSSSEFGMNNAVSSLYSVCTTCRIREIDKNIRIMNFKQQILNILKIKNLPNTTGVPIPKLPALDPLYAPSDEVMLSDSPYQKGSGNGKYKPDDEYGDFVVKTERVFIGAKPAPTGLHFNLTDIVFFPPSLQLFTSRIKRAVLWYYVRNHDVTPTFVTIERILPESLSGRKIVKKVVYFQKLTKEKDFGWRRFDMRDTLHQWIKYPISNLGLQMRAEAVPGINLIVLPPAKVIDKGYEPWLDTKIMEPKSNSRRRRSESLVCVENSTDSRCCRHPLLVGFAEFGWDWIIAPTHVKADYCTGECRLTMQDNTPYSWVNQQMPGSNTCCTPTKLSPLPLLYFDESMDIVYTILQNMKVDKCGCA